jgi:hypothetical protein
MRGPSVAASKKPFSQAGMKLGGMEPPMVWFWNSTRLPEASAFCSCSSRSSSSMAST